VPAALGAALPAAPVYREDNMFLRLWPCAALLVASPVWACSTCQCGDYTVTLMGVEKAYAGRLRVSYETQWREEAQGTRGVDERVSEEVRQVLGLSYAFNANVTVALRVPYVQKQFNDASGGGQQAAGLGDADLIAQAVIGRSRAPSRHLWGVQTGVRLPTGPEQRAQGRMIDIDAQPGTGAVTPSLGGFYRYYRFPHFTAASVVWSDPQEGDQGFDGGRAVVATLSQQYALSQDVSLQLSLEARDSAQHRYDGVADPNSGGWVSYATPGIGWRVAGDWLLYAQAQLPIADDLNGRQREEGEIRAGLVVDLSN
jgi:hypothetical protein